MLKMCSCNIGDHGYDSNEQETCSLVSAKDSIIVAPCKIVVDIQLASRELCI